MKTNLDVIFLRTGILNKEITVLVAQNNEGINQFFIEDIYGYVVCKASEHPFILKNLKVTRDKKKICIAENGEDTSAIIEEKIIK